MGKRARAAEERRVYEAHDRPPRPFTVKCLHCGEMHSPDSLRAAKADARRHAGIHGGLDQEHAQVVVVDGTGVELFRTHAIWTEDRAPETCPDCEATRKSDWIVCRECGHIPEEHRAEEVA